MPCLTGGPLWHEWALWTAARVELDEPGVIAFDTETTGLGYFDEPFCATLSWRGRDGSLQNGYLSLGPHGNAEPGEEEGGERRAALLGHILRTVGVVVGHNLKFDLQKALLCGALSTQDVEELEIHDTQTIYILLDENQQKGLKKLAVRILKYDDTIAVPYKSGKQKGQVRYVSREKHELDAVRRKLKLTKDDGYHLLPRRVLIPYALRDTDFTLQLFEKLYPLLESKDDRLRHLYSESMDLKRALLDMEADGFALDMDWLKATHSEYGIKVMESWNRLIELTGKPDLNPNAPAQLIEALRERGLPVESTDKSELKKLDDELAREILAYRHVTKLHKTYLTGLLKEQRDGRIHPNFNDDGATTGRMSSGKSAG